MASLISQQHHNFETVFSVINILGRKILFWLFQHGCSDKDSSESLKTYLTTKKSWSNGDIKKSFNKTMLHNIDNDFSCSTFDISLYFVLINKCCSNIDHQNWTKDDSMEGLVKQIKDHRNDTAHGEPTISDSVKATLLGKLKTLFQDAVKAIAVRYQIPSVDEHIFWSDVEKDFDFLTQVVRGEDEILLMLEKIFVERISCGSRELKESYIQWSKIKPVFFLDGFQDFEVEVDAVFTEIVISDAGRREKGEKVGLKDIISEKKENIVLIEGQAGAGKSTLLKYFLSSWVKGSLADLQLIQDYELLVFFECRNRSMDSLLDLISYLLPETVVQYSMLDPLKILKGIKVLFLIDGLDELNPKSLNVVREILDFAQKPNFVTICTSRPSELKNFYKLKPASSKLRHLRLDGIPSDCYEVFVERLHKHLGEASKVTDTAMLVQYIRKAPETIRSHFNFPLNLTLLSVLWVISPEKVNRVTSVTTLYIELLDLVTEKLVERLKKSSECMQYSVDMLKEISIIAYHRICEVAVGDLFRNKYVLEDKDCDSIDSFCKSVEIEEQTVKLPSSEVLAAYLTTRHTWTSRTSKIQYSYPHRSFQEHMAAVYICDSLLTSNLTIAGFFESIEQKKFAIKVNVGTIHPYDFSFFDLFPHIVGVLAFRGEDALHNYGVDFVEHIKSMLVKIKTMADYTKDSDWWLDFLAEAQNGDMIASASVDAMPQKEWFIRDKHVKPAGVMLKYIKQSPKRFDVNLISHPSHLEGLEDFVARLSTMESILAITVHHNFWHPDHGNTDDIARKTFSGRCHLEEFRGHISQEKLLKMLPKSLKSLALAISSDNFLSASFDALHKLPNLEHLDILLTPGLPLYLMRPLPSTPTKIELRFSGSTDKYIVWLVNAALNLQSSKGYSSVSVVGPVTLESTSGHHTAGGDGITLKGYKNLLRFCTDAAFGNFGMSPAIPGQLAPEGYVPPSEENSNVQHRGSSPPSDNGALSSSSHVQPFPRANPFETPHGKEGESSISSVSSPFESVSQSSKGQAQSSFTPISSPFGANAFSKVEQSSIPGSFSSKKSSAPFDLTPVKAEISKPKCLICSQILVWSFRISDEQRMKAKEFKCKVSHTPMKGVPW